MHSNLIDTNGTRLHVVEDGEGEPVLLLHGWPHTGELWSLVLPDLARDHHVIVPDLRGLGASERPDSGYDANTISHDLSGLLDRLSDRPATVVALDASVPAAFLLGTQQPDRVRRLILMESLLPPLPGAESMTTPWWFGFHAIPGLAETVVEGHESAYLNWFLRNGTFNGQGLPPAMHSAFVRAYTGRDALRAGFSYYRVAAQNAALISAAGRLTVPTLAIGGNSIGDRLYRQLSTVTDDLRGELWENCGHLVPIDQPAKLVAKIRKFSAQ